ncbi:phosphatase PAP2 family protein [Nocardioides sp. TRM66260-LWL]|uniref:phosphatase PAP2 family protein n=1 Tax=Nocardioides sp. TRM66260-LWL TaxID=2874478 RepID=UPI001CC4B212|nr:phosphatase PAP2 family protein [Nocardioides sp. TRM66260-LWL]MBZ5734989.1 phosphatase PAP2 family protein [Nocardioides sp. TRM66260-LWL]
MGYAELAGAARARRRTGVLAAVLEIATVLALFGVYNVGRLIATNRVATADDHARQLLDLERWLGLPSEEVLQRLAFKVPDLIAFADRYYVSVHFPLTVAVLVWLYAFRRPAYTWAKWGLILATAVAMVVHIVVPMTPPRLLTGLDMVDTGARAGQSVYAGTSPVGGLANEYAAMPSLHVGWALLLAVVLVRTCRTRWRWLWMAHPVITMVVVVVTANHYLLDGVAGSLLVLAGLWVSARLWAPAYEAAGLAQREQAPEPSRPAPVVEAG